MNTRLFLAHASAIVAIGAVLATPALSQEEKKIVERNGNTITEILFAPPGEDDIPVDMLRAFDQVKQSDPAVASAIARNPRIVENDSWVQKHPQLVAFFEKYPDARNEVEDNPGNFVVPVIGSRSRRGESTSSKE